MDLSNEQAEELVTDLQVRRIAGEDDLDLIVYVGNKLRIGRRDARNIYNSFYIGFQHGAAEILGADTVTTTPEKNNIFHAAVAMGRQTTLQIIEDNQRKPNAASGCRAIAGQFVLASLFVSWMWS